MAKNGDLGLGVGILGIVDQGNSTLIENKLGSFAINHQDDKKYGVLTQVPKRTIESITAESSTLNYRQEPKKCTMILDEDLRILLD